MPRKVLPVEEATNDGSRALRELLRRLTFGQLAKRLTCTPSTVRKWAKELRMPTAAWRERMFLLLDIPLGAWERFTGVSAAITRMERDARCGRDRVIPPTPPRKESTLCPDSETGKSVSK